MKLKRIVAGGVAVTAAVVVAGYAIIASLDVQQVADFARAQVKAATGRNRSIAGPVERKTLPPPSIQLQRSEARRGGEACVSTGRPRWSPSHSKKQLLSPTNLNV